MINNPRIYQDVFGSIQGGLSQIAGASERHNTVYGAGDFHRQMVQACAHGTQVTGCAKSSRILAGMVPAPDAEGRAPPPGNGSAARRIIKALPRISPKLGQIQTKRA